MAWSVTNLDLTQHPKLNKQQSFNLTIEFPLWDILYAGVVRIW